MQRNLGLKLNDKARPRSRSSVHTMLCRFQMSLEEGVSEQRYFAVVMYSEEIGK